MQGITRCFECQKIATIQCFQCLNEFEEPKRFCFICDNNVHKGIVVPHQKETISYSKQFEHQKSQPLQKYEQIYSNQIDRRYPSRQNDERIDQGYNGQIQYQQQNNPKENLQFFKDLKYTSNNSNARNINYEDRFKSTDNFNSNQNQFAINTHKNTEQRQNNYLDGGRGYQHQSNPLLSRQQYDTSKQDIVEERFKQQIEQQNQQKIDAKTIQDKKSQENQFKLKSTTNNDSFNSSDENKKENAPNHLKQGFINEEDQNKINNGNKNKITFSNNNKSGAHEPIIEKKVLDEEQQNEKFKSNIHTSSQKFKQQLEQEINELKKYSTIQNNKYKSSIQNNQNFIKKQDTNVHYNTQNQGQDRSYQKSYELTKNPDQTAQDEYKQVKNDIKQYFGNQKDLDERENEVLNRINEIKKKISPQVPSQGLQQQDMNIENRLNNKYREFSDRKEQQNREGTLTSKQFSSKHQRINSQNERREQEFSSDQFGSGKKFKNDFENLISQVGQNEERSYIEGLKNIYQQEIKNIEIKNKIKVQELENTISYLRQHMDLMEERNKETINTIQTDLLNQKQVAIEQERDSKYGLNEVRLQYQEEISHLQLQLETERAKYIQLEKKVEQYQTHYQLKLREMADITKKTKLDSEGQKVKYQEYADEMEEQIQDMRVRMAQENENAIQKIKIDYDGIVEDLKFQVKDKSEQIDKQEKQMQIDSQIYYQKERELKKEVQELERQIENLQNEVNEIQDKSEQFKNIAAEQEGELDNVKREKEQLEEQQQWLEQEKIQLQEQIDKFQKQIYGDKKEKSIVKQLQGQQPSRKSLSRASSSSIKSINSKKKSKIQINDQ